MAKKRIRASTAKRARSSKKKATRKQTSAKGARKAVKKKAVRKAAAKATKRTAKSTRKKATRKVAQRPKVKRAAKTLKKKVTRKAVKKTAKKKATRKAARKTVRKTVAKKTAKRKTTRKKVTRRPGTKKKTAARLRVTTTKARAAKPVKPAAKPKRPRRTKQALPPDLRVVSAPVVDVEPLTPPSAPAAPPPTQPPAIPVGDLVGETAETPPPLETECVAAPPGAEGRPTTQAGDPAPDFDLCDETGQRHTLSQYRGQSVVLYFYPKDDTPGCTAEACGLRDVLGDFERHNALVLGVSPDPVDSHRRFSQRYGLTFPLLADEDHAVAEKYGVWVEKKSGYGKAYMGIARTTFIIDPEGRIARIFHDVKPHGHEREILEHLTT